MKKYKILYWYNGNILDAECSAETKKQAKYWFLMCVSHDDIISIDEVKE